MIGNNQLDLNEATMILIVQQWLDRQMKKSAPQVTSVKSDKEWFIVCVQEKSNTTD